MPPIWHQPITDYTTTCLAQGMTLSTIRLRRHYLARLAAVYPDPAQVTRADVDAFLARSDWKPETRKSAAAAVRSFFRWAVERGVVADDPTLRMPAVRVPAGVPHPVPDDVLERSLVAASDRVRLMLELGAFAGLRRAEIAALRGEDCDGSALQIVGKGGVARRVPLHPRLVGRLPEAGWVFSDGHGGHLSADYVGRLMKRALPAPWTAHSLRHRFATRAYAGSGDLLAVQRLLGHSRPETTQRYTLVDAERMRVAVAAA